MSMSRRVCWAVLGAVLAALPATTPHAAATGATATYVSGGTAVVRANGQPVVDEGTVVCDDGNGVGVGGFCLPFGGGDAIAVADEAAGENVAFQVCVDNSGDGVCTSPDFGACADVVVFSHDDDDHFYNPVGPVPTGFADDCPGGPWKGYVVLLCDGVHVSTSAHAHPATSGTGTVVTGGEGLGTFCGGGPQPSRKPYEVGSGARYLGGGAVVSRSDGEPTADEGAVMCNGGDNVGLGGFCTSFGDGNAMAVFDEVSGTDVAFQVCIDNSGDGVCTSPDNRSHCPDLVYFSHADDGAFYNPLGPIQSGFSAGCGSFTPWQGYVVFLCEGTHADGLSPHAHAATSGSGRVTKDDGEGLGTFCGGSHSAASNKRYTLDSAVREVPRSSPFAVFTTTGECAMTATSDPSPDGTLGGQGARTGEVTMLVVAGEPTAQLTGVACEIQVNGALHDSTSQVDGTGVVSGVDVVTFTVQADSDVVELCAAGQEDGVPFRRCVQAVGNTIPPQEAMDVAGDVADTVEGVVP